MFNRTKIALSTAIVLGTAFSASAATKPHSTHVHRSALYNMAPDLSTPAYEPVRDYITDPIIAPEPDLHRPGR
jgi:hypothetical protein